MIPLIDLSIDERLRKKISKEIEKVLKSKNYILGKKLESFEKNFAKYIGTKFAIGVGNGTDALRLSLRALNVGPGDEVLTVALTSPFTALAIIEEGAAPVFCDIDEKTLTLNVTDAERKVNKKTKAIIPVHIYGNPCEMEKILKLAKKYKLIVIEDACQAHGARFKNKMIGSFGQIGAFSFYPTKNLGAFGDAGMVVTNNSKIANKIKILRHGGQTKRFWHEFRGINSRLDEIQAAVLDIKLKFLEKENLKRKKVAERYLKNLKNLPVDFQLNFQFASPANHLFVLRTKNRDRLQKFLAKKGIKTDVYYPAPLHKQPLFSKFNSSPLTITENVCKELIALPLFPSLTKDEQNRVIQSIKEFFAKGKN